MNMSDYLMFIKYISILNLNEYSLFRFYYHIMFYCTCIIIIIYIYIYI